jgi:beta-lactam-binding protein with PASTA domain
MPRRCLEIVDGVLEALDYSHRNGIIHRDVKPANVMITPDGSVKVMDFGIARAVADTSSTITQTAAVLGTAQYLSPEQAQGGTVDARSDVYSAGCLLYELLTGRPPFTGESAVAVAYQHVREMPPPPSTLNGEVPADTDAIVMKALAKNPENRYQTAAEMRDDIARTIAGVPVSAPMVLSGSATTELPAATTAALTMPTDLAAAPPPRRRGRYVWLTVAVLAAVAVLAYGAFAVLGGGPTKVSVTDVRGLTLGEARSKIEAQGLVVGTVDPQSSDLPKNRVISQTPPQGSSVDEGSTVDLVVSSGPATVDVPVLVNFDQQTANAKLAAVGLVPGQPKQVNSDQPAGTVVSSDPPAGTPVAVGSTVTLSISTGKVTVPDVVTQTEAQARAALTQAGFVPVVISQIDATAAPGTVLAQSPTAGTPLRLGSTVTITVAVAPTPTPTPTTPTPSPTAT